MTKKKILLAFSGGVDSAVAAYLCGAANWDIFAVNMRFLPDPEEEQSRAETERVASALGLKVHFLDLREEFRSCVMHRCWEVFDSGKTPNPCAICNPVFKFGKLMEFALQNDCEALATGHYAQIRNNPDGSCAVARGIHRAKDQSYFLFGLSQEQIAFSRFPLGGMTKEEVRMTADSLGLPNAQKKESQDACFTPPDGTLAEMLRTEFDAPVRPGCFIHADNGKVLGRHKGIHAYTIGQRKGTGIALGTPAYVSRIDALHNAVYVTQDEQTLFTGTLTAERVNWQLAAAPSPGTTFRARVQIRYRSGAVPAEVSVTEDGHTCTVNFDSPVRAVTPGQAAVFYCEDDERILGGGFIR